MAEPNWSELAADIGDEILDCWNAECGEEAKNLESKIEKLQDIAQSLAPDLKEQLAETAASLEAAFQESSEGLAGSMANLDTVAAQLAELFVDDVPAMLQSSIERIQTAFDQTDLLLRMEYVSQVSDNCSAQVQRTSHVVEAASNRIDEQFELLVADTTELVANLKAQLDGFGEEWNEQVEEVKTEYDRIVNKVMTLGEEVTKLTEAIDDGMRLTGGGMNAAVDVLGEIKLIMEEIA